MKYNLTREEVAELFQLGKLLKTHDSMDKKILHTNLEMLTWPQPHLRPNQLKWWMKQLDFYSLENPEWMFEASIEMLTNDYLDNNDNKEPVKTGGKDDESK